MKCVLNSGANGVGILFDGSNEIFIQDFTINSKSLTNAPLFTVRNAKNLTIDNLKINQVTFTKASIIAVVNVDYIAFNKITVSQNVFSEISDSPFNFLQAKNMLLRDIVINDNSFTGSSLTQSHLHCMI